MPAISHLAPRFLEGSSSGGISGTAIGLIVGLGIVPVIILVWVVSWLFWCYPYDRSCCCTRRKKKEQPIEENPGPFHKTGRSLDSLHEKAAYPMPARPSNNYRTESGNSYTSNTNNNAYGGNRLTKSDPRFSMNSTNTIQLTQEPKRFV